MLHKVEDESGGVWYIDDNDPAGAAVKGLKAHFYGYIVLPRLTLTTGRLAPYATLYWLHEAHQARYNESEGRDATANRLYRLAECVNLVNRLLLLPTFPPLLPSLPSLPEGVTDGSN